MVAQAPMTPRVGVLALQGDVREHMLAVAAAGGEGVRVRRPEELAGCAALVLPGGESTTIGKLARAFGLLEPVRERIAAGMPVLGTCAGMIMLADRVVDGATDQITFGGLDVTVRRNAFGRQVDSFEHDLTVEGVAAPVRGVFIRAPWVEKVGSGVQVLATLDDGTPTGRIVAVREGALMATSFHPEVGGDSGVHRSFLDLVRSA